MSATSPRADAEPRAGPDGDAVETLTDREVRGLRERIVVFPRDEPGICSVYSESGTEYTVDVFADHACTCPDREHNDPEGPCKHEFAAKALLGVRELPEWIDTDAINAQLSGDRAEEW